MDSPTPKRRITREEWEKILSVAKIRNTPKKTITREEWEKKLSDIKIRKEDMNKMVMNFFILKGFSLVAGEFRTESGTKNVDLASIPARTGAKRALECGKAEDAFKILAGSFPQVLNKNTQLTFQLHQQQFIELIHQNKVEEALKFVKEKFTPWGELNPENPELRDKIEKTITLLAYEDPSNSPVGELMDRSNLLRTADAVNKAILTSQNCETDHPASFLKRLIWVQNQLNKRVAYPRLNVSSGNLEDPVI